MIRLLQFGTSPCDPLKGTTPLRGLMGGWFICRDLRIGEYINCYNRQLLLRDCDEFTRRFYIDRVGFSEADFAPVSADDGASTPTFQPPCPPQPTCGSDSSRSENSASPPVESEAWYCRARFSFLPVVVLQKGNTCNTCSLQACLATCGTQTARNPRMKSSTLDHLR